MDIQKTTRIHNTINSKSWLLNSHLLCNNKANTPRNDVLQSFILANRADPDYMPHYAFTTHLGVSSVQRLISQYDRASSFAGNITSY